MAEQKNQDVSPLAAQPIPPASAPTSTNIAPITPPPVSGRPSCGYTLVIVIITVIMTIVAEAVIGFALVSFAFHSWWKEIQKELSATSSVTQSEEITVIAGNSKKTALTKDQKELLSKLGIKPEDLPEDFPIEKIACIQNAIGPERIKAIMSGAETPGFKDLYRAKVCI